MTVHITKETYSPSASWWEHTSPLSKYSYPKPNLNPIKPLDLLVNLQEIQGTKRSFKLHHRDEINKIQMATNSARANNPISSGNKFQGKKEKE